MLVALAIMAGLMIWLVPRYLASTRSLTTGKTVAAPIERAHGVECMTNLRQIRSAIQMAQASSETPPRSLADLSSFGVTPALMSCPVSHQPYRYDPQSGRVWCTYPPHQSY